MNAAISMQEKIVLLAHGSSDERWAQTFVTLTRQACEDHSNVVLGFMELSEPSLEACIKEACDEGYQSVSVLPLFLAKGKHLHKDVPAMLERYSKQYDLPTRLLDPIGEHPALASAISSIIEDTVSP